MSKFFRYHGQIYEIFETEGLFSNGPPRFSVCRLNKRGPRDLLVADHRDLLEIAMLGVRVDENGDPLIPQDVVRNLSAALENACAEGWMWKIRTSHAKVTYATHEKREDAARRIFRMMGSEIPQDAGAALYKRLKKLNVTVFWSQPKKV